MDNLITLKTLRMWYNQDSKSLNNTEIEEFQKYLKIKANCAKQGSGLNPYSVIKSITDVEHSKKLLEETKMEFNILNQEVIPYRKLFLPQDQTPKEWLELENRIIKMATIHIFNLGKEVFAEWNKKDSKHGGLTPYGQVDIAINNILARRNK